MRTEKNQAHGGKAGGLERGPSEINELFANLTLLTANLAGGRVCVPDGVRIQSGSLMPATRQLGHLESEPVSSSTVRGKWVLPSAASFLSQPWEYCTALF